jgi:ADP-ribosyl-[dinitrogen reductase] hydrolase
VVASLEAALWAFSRGSDFESSVLLAANLGDDADTTAAICGQLAGAYYGVDSIPARWRARLVDAKMIEELAEGLYDLASA